MRWARRETVADSVDPEWPERAGRSNNLVAQEVFTFLTDAE
jgi:hypothetical protein